MQHTLKSPTAAAPQSNWVYAALTVIDGSRSIKPAQVAFDVIEFDQAPRLGSEKVEIILRNGDEEQRHFAIVLPHDPAATRIPIRLLPPHRLR